MPKSRVILILLLALTFRLQIWAVGLANRDRDDWGLYYGFGVLAEMLTPDSYDYLRYWDAWGSDADGLTALRTPGYPVLLELAGTPEIRFGLTIVLLLQLVFEAVTTWLVMHWACRGWGSRAGTVAGLLYALSPVSASASLRVLSETSFALLLTAGMVLATRALQTKEHRKLTWGVLLLIAACYFRPIGLIPLCVLGAALVVGWLGSRRSRQAGRALGLWACLTVLCIGPWVVRNGLTHGYWGFSAIASVNLIKYEAPATLAQVGESAQEEAGQAESDTRDAPQAGEQEEDPDGQAEAQPSEKNARRGPEAFWQELRRERSEAVGVLASHPFAWAWMHLRSSLATLLPGVTDAMEVAGWTAGQKGTLEVLNRRGLWAAVEHYFGGQLWLVALAGPFLLLLAVKYLLALAACFGLLAGGIRLHRAWLVLSFLTMLFAGGPASTPRFRVPLEPMLCVGAGVGLVLLLSGRGQRADRRARD